MTAIRDRIKELVRVRAGDLAPNPKNWRRHPAKQEAAMRGVLAELGYADALLARETPDGLMLIDGHLRASLDPEQTVPVLVLDVNEEEADYLLATLDPLAAMSERDNDMVAELLTDVRTGQDAVRDLLETVGGAQATEGLTDPDEAPPLSPLAAAQRGQVWLLGEHRLMCGDATEKRDVVRLMAGVKAEMCLTDPPYLVDYDGGRHPQSWSNRASVRDKHWDTYHEREQAQGFYEAFIRTALDSALVENAGWYQWYASLRAPEVHDAWRICGLLTHAVIVWSKTRPVLTHTRYMWQHELCVYGWLEGRQPKTRPPANATTLWEFDQRHANEDHPTQKPVGLFERSIEHQTLSGEIVYDPFLGSGTTIIAAERLGRRCYALEIEPLYVDVAVRRWEEFTGGMAKLVD